MTNTEYQEILKDMFSKILVLTERKGSDYASDNDTLRNFKVTSTNMSLLQNKEYLPSDICLFFITTKIARLANLKGKDPKCESVQDTIMDLINYTGLYYANLLEEK